MNIKLTFDERCWLCEGDGKISTSKGIKKIECGQCKGVDYTLTDDGYEFLNFIRRHLKLPQTA